SAPAAVAEVETKADSREFKEGDRVMRDIPEFDFKFGIATGKSRIKTTPDHKEWQVRYPATGDGTPMEWIEAKWLRLDPRKLFADGKRVVVTMGNLKNRQ